MTMDIPTQSAAMLYVFQVRFSGPVGARSSLYRREAPTSSFIALSRTSSLSARSVNSSCANVLPFLLCPLHPLGRPLDLSLLHYIFAPSAWRRAFIGCVMVMHQSLTEI